MGNKISIEQALKAYQVMHAPAKYSWKKYWAEEQFSSPVLSKCSEYEQKQFDKRLKECTITICDRINVKNGRVSTLDGLVRILTDPDNKDVAKGNRRVVYSSSDGIRPTGDDAYFKWNGFQVIDMDIKDAKIAKAMKTRIFKALCKCNWFLGVALSASGCGLHIYTKIAIPEELNIPIKGDTVVKNFRGLDKAKLFYMTNFRHKFSFVYIACLQYIEELGINKDTLISWMDMHQGKPQQGAYIGYDKNVLINTGFFEDYIYMDFDNSTEIGSDVIDWISHPDIREMFKTKLHYEMDDGSDHIDISASVDSDKHVDTHTKIHYKHDERWRLANTLVNLYGKEKGYIYLRSICSNNIKDKELSSDCDTAKRYQKPVDAWAVNRLNTVHGFSIKMDVKDEEIKDDELFASMAKISNPTIIHESKYTKTFNLKANEYLGHIRSEIIDECGIITLIEAGAGVGKTEMVKSLVKAGKRVLMVMPFTSTIKAKVENDPDWYYCYGRRKVKLDMPNNGLCMTVDKFAGLAKSGGLVAVKTAGFDYIFIDESHLLFMSEYRSVMPEVVRMISNTEVPIILMSGTPSGELAFFSNAVHLRVIKEETRKKMFTVHLTETMSDMMYKSCRDMAKHIASGGKIIFPTNRGSAFSEQVRAAVNFFLRNEHAIYDEVKLEYYKKSNVGDTFMDDVNIQKTVKDVQILMCTTYLSVGVDILDRHKFKVVFVDLMMPQEIEQFANRLRSNDLFIDLYISKNDAEGNSRSLHKYRDVNFAISADEMNFINSVILLCNKQIKRNNQEYKSNTILLSLLSGAPYIKRMPDDDIYYLDEIAYKTICFERKYREYIEQLPVLMKGMEAYGYEVMSENLNVSEAEGIEDFANLKDLVKLAYDDRLQLNTTHIEELMGVITENNLDTFKSVLNGSCDIKKGANWDIKPNLDGILTVKNVEVFEKVVPIFVSMSKRYDISVIREIFESCRNKNGTFNFAAIGRIRTLINLAYNDKNKSLDLPIKDFMYATYDFSEQGMVKKGEIENFCNKFAEDYARMESTESMPIYKSMVTMDTLREKFFNLFKCLVKIGRASKKTNGMVPMERVELLWKEKEYYTSTNLNEKLFIFAEFLENIK